MRVNVSKAFFSKTFMYGLKVTQQQQQQQQRQLTKSNKISLEFYLNLIKFIKQTLIITATQLVALNILKEFAIFANLLQLLLLVFQLINIFISFNVFNRLTVLMNDFRLKTFYCNSSKSNKSNKKLNKSSKFSKKTTFINTNLLTTASTLNLKSSATFKTSLSFPSSSTSSTTSASSSAAAAASAVAFATSAILFKKQTSSKNNNHHRTYNNSSKSNKVFLYYTPRDPRLRIFLKTKQFFNRPQQQFTLLNNKIKDNNCCFSDKKSLLKVSRDLCNYGELIGGGDNHKRGEYNTNNNNNNYNKNNSVSFINKTIVKQLNCVNFKQPKEICDNLIETTSDNLLIVATAGAAIEIISANISIHIIVVAVVLSKYTQELLKTIEILLSFHYKHQQLNVFKVKSTFGLHDSIL